MPVSTTGRPAAVLSILVTANTRSAQAQLAALDRQLAYSVKNQGRGAAALNRSLTALKFGVVGLTAATAGAVAAATSFEDHFANVRKTVSGTPKELNKVRREIIGLSKEIPISANALADLAGQAGALGVPTKQLTKFTETAAKLSVATDDLSAEEAANSLARLGTIMDVKKGENYAKTIHRMGSVLVDLGNKGASTEGEIAAMSLRIAGAAKASGATVQQVEGLAASLANVGIRAEMGGSAISRVINGMQAAIEVGGKELAHFADIAGMSSEQFTNLFERNVPKAIVAFVKGLAEVRKQGESTTLELQGLGDAAHTSFSEVRIGDTLRRLAGNSDNLTRSLHIANKEWRQNTALNVEAHKKFETFANQLTVLKNQVVAAGIAFGTELLPGLKEIVGALSDEKLEFPERIEKALNKLVDFIGEAVPKMLEVGVKVGGAVAKGILDGFLHAEPLAQAAMVAGFIRLLGGPGTLTLLGTTIFGSIFSGSALMAALGNSTLANTLGVWFLEAGAGPLAIAAGGLVNILLDVLGGDLEGAMKEAGGAAAGALIGGVVGGLPGALIGSGIGTVLGDLLGDQMDKIELAPKITLGDMAKQAENQAKRAAKAVQEAAKGVRKSEERMDETRKKARRSTNRLHEAEQRLSRIRKRYGPNSEEAIRAEKELARAKERSNRADRRAARAEKYHGEQREFYKDKLKRALVTEKTNVSLQKEQRREAWRNYKAQKEGSREAADAFKKWEAENKDVNEAQKQLNDTMDKGGKVIGDNWLKKMGPVTDELARNRTLAKKTSQIWHNDLIKNAEDVTKAIGLTPRGGAGTSAAINSLNEVMDETSPAAKEMIREALHPAQQETRGLGDVTDRSTKIIETSWKDLPPPVQKAIDSGILGPVNRVLEELGIKRSKFSIDVSKKGQQPPGGGGSNPKHARGAIVPGIGSGDTVPLHVGGQHVAMVEPGELISVTNRRATAALMDVNSQISRYARGGWVDPAGPGTGVVNPAIADVVGQWSTRYNAAINYGYDPGGGHVSPGHNVTGTATDTGPAAGWTPQATTLFESGLKAVIQSGLEVLYGSHGIGTPWPGHGFQNHAHIEWGMHPMIQGMIKAKIPRPILEGPPGKMTELGQAAIDKVRKAAQEWVSRHLATSGPDMNLPPGGDAAANARLGHKMLVEKPSGRFNSMRWGPYGESEWPPYNRLIMSESGWSTTATNPSSGAYGIPQSLPAGKMAAAGPDWRTDPATQIAWGLDYIQDVYGAPSNTPLGGYARGGVLRLARGTGKGKKGNGKKKHQHHKPPNIPEGKKGSFRNIFNADVFAKKMRTVAQGPGDRRVLTGDARRNIKTTTILPFVTGGGELAGPLGKLRDAADLYAENADFASSLGFEIGDVETPGVYAGLSEAGWLELQLSALFQLRNKLIIAEKFTDRGLTIVKRIKDRLKAPKGLLAEINERMRTIRKKIRQLGKDREDIKKQLEEAGKSEEKAREQLRNQLEREMDKPKKKRDEKLIARLREQLSSKGSKGKDGLKELLEQNAKDLKHAKHALVIEGALRTSLKEVIVPQLSERITAIADTKSTLMDEIITVQGAGIKPFKPRKEKPPFGTWKGEYGDVEIQLRDLGLDALETSSGESDSARTSTADLLEFARAAALGAFGSTYQIPGLASGGVGHGLVKVGERGEEMVRLGSPSRVFNNYETEQMKSGSAGGVDLSGMQVIVMIGNETIKETVNVEIRQRDGKVLAKHRQGDGLV